MFSLKDGNSYEFAFCHDQMLHVLDCPQVSEGVSYGDCVFPHPLSGHPLPEGEGFTEIALSGLSTAVLYLLPFRDLPHQETVEECQPLFLLVL